MLERRSKEPRESIPDHGNVAMTSLKKPKKNNFGAGNHREIIATMELGREIAGSKRENVRGSDFVKRLNYATIATEMAH